MYVLGHKQIQIFNNQMFFNFQFQMFKCVLTSAQRVPLLLFNLYSQRFHGEK